MQSKIQLKSPMVVVNILAIVSFFVLIFFFYQVKPIVQSSFVIEQQATSTTSVVSVGLPVRLKIPSLNIDSVIESVGLNSYGVMGAPKGPSTVGWFNLGPRPGEVGNAVIDGHFGWKDGIPAVFDTLHTIRKGDKLYVEDEKGLVTIFVVHTIKNYDSGAEASGVFNSDDGGIHLNLITCGGLWDKINKSYSSRLVVFADKE